MHLSVCLRVLTPHPSAQMCRAASLMGRALGWGVRLHAAPPDTRKSVKGKSALLAELLVQLVFIRKTRTSCRCHDGFFFSLLGRSSESGMRGASLRTGEPRDTVSAHPWTSGRFSCWPARAQALLHTHAHARRRVHRRAITHRVRLMVGLCAGAAGEDGLFKYHTGWRCELTAWRASTD